MDEFKKCSPTLWWMRKHKRLRCRNSVESNTLWLILSSSEHTDIPNLWNYPSPGVGGGGQTAAGLQGRTLWTCIVMPRARLYQDPHVPDPVAAGTGFEGGGCLIYPFAAVSYKFAYADVFQPCCIECCWLMSVCTSCRGKTRGQSA